MPELYDQDADQPAPFRVKGNTYDRLHEGTPPAWRHQAPRDVTWGGGRCWLLAAMFTVTVLAAILSALGVQPW